MVRRAVSRNKERINSTVRQTADALPIPYKTKQWIKRTITAGAILRALNEISGAADYAENWIYRAIERVVPGMPDWISRRIAAAIAFVLF